MTHMRDIEELIASISDQTIKCYMSEALVCYSSSAYRASIVLSFIALFDDLLSKLQELGKVNKKARKLYEEASKKQSDQEVFESYLIDQLKATGLMPALDATFLDIIRTLRNKAAHPSGHAPSAEEARYVMSESITRFLSKPILTTTQMADFILANLSNSNYFPNNKVDGAESVVRLAINGLHPETYTYLILQLLNKFSDSNATINKNAKFFLYGLAAQEIDSINTVMAEKLIKPYSSSDTHFELISSCIAINPNLIKDIDQVTIERLANMLSIVIKNTEVYEDYNKVKHPAKLLSCIIKNQGESFVLDNLQDQYRQIFKKFPFIPELVSSLATAPTMRSEYISMLIERAGSTTFDTANEYSSSIPSIDESLAAIIDKEAAFAIIVAIVCAANWGAYRAMDLVTAKFDRIQHIKSLATGYLTENPDQAEAFAAARYCSITDIRNHLDLPLPV